jgi:CheY-like chemotaxis protein
LAIAPDRAMIDAPNKPDGATILVVDDEAVAREIAVAGLESLNYQVITAPDAGSALRLLKTRENVDLLFTDIMMPGGLNGISLAKRAKLLRPSLKILYATAYSDLRAQVIENYGKVIRKPYPIAELDSEIRRALLGGYDTDPSDTVVQQNPIWLPISILASTLIWALGYTIYRLISESLP